MSNENIHIRLCTIKDVTLIMLFERLAFAEDFGDYSTYNANILEYYKDSFSKENIANELENSECLYFFAFIGILPIGFAKLKYNSCHANIEERNVSELLNLYVLNDFRNKGIECRLYNTLVIKVKENEQKGIWTYSKNKSCLLYLDEETETIVNQYIKIGNENFERIVILKKL